MTLQNGQYTTITTTEKIPKDFIKCYFFGSTTIIASDGRIVLGYEGTGTSFISTGKTYTISVAR